MITRRSLVKILAAAAVAPLIGHKFLAPSVEPGFTFLDLNGNAWTYIKASEALDCQLLGLLGRPTSRLSHPMTGVVRGYLDSCNWGVTSVAIPSGQYGWAKVSGSTQVQYSVDPAIKSKAEAESPESRAQWLREHENDEDWDWDDDEDWDED